MMGENEDRTLKNLKACRSLTDESIISNHGRIFGSAGDSIIAEFASPVDAVIAATEFQRNLSLRNEGVTEENKMMFRVGLNLGDVIVEGDNLYGDGVNVASRLEALAEPGGISLSGKFHDEVSRKLDMSFVSTGEQEMKNIQNPIPTFKIEITEIDNTEANSSPEIIDSISKSESDEKINSESKPPAIAVLPFTNMSGDPEQEFFVDGITEDIITNLSLWRTFPVISRNSSFTYRGQNQNLKHVANELGARYIVEGSVRKGGNRLRITAQLIDASEDHHLWSEKWDRTLEDVFDVQDEVSEAVARRVAPSITGYEQNRLIRKRPENLTAWEEYLQGLRYYHDRHHTDYEDPNLEKARKHFEKAIDLDSTLSDAHAFLAFCGTSELGQRLASDPKKVVDQILASASKSKSLDSENPLAYLSLAAGNFFQGELKASVVPAKRAVQLNPSHAISHFWLGLTQAHTGLYEEAESALLKAIELSPVDPELGTFFTGLFFANFGQNNYEKALEAIDNSLRLNPGRGNFMGFRASVLGELNSSEAKEALDRYLTLRPNLKKRDDYRSIFVPNSTLADPIIEGLIKAGWQPE
jgi:TolB-like protein